MPRTVPPCKPLRSAGARASTEREDARLWGSPGGDPGSRAAAAGPTLRPCVREPDRGADRAQRRLGDHGSHPGLAGIDRTCLARRSAVRGVVLSIEMPTERPLLARQIMWWLSMRWGTTAGG